MIPWNYITFLYRIEYLQHSKVQKYIRLNYTGILGGCFKLNPPPVNFDWSVLFCWNAGNVWLRFRSRSLKEKLYFQIGTDGSWKAILLKFGNVRTLLCKFIIVLYISVLRLLLLKKKIMKICLRFYITNLFIRIRYCRLGPFKGRFADYKVLA